MLSIEEIDKIANLAKLQLTAEEKERHAKTISAVLDYMKILDSVNTENIEPTFEVNELKNIWRKDEVVNCDYAGRLVEQFPEKSFDMLAVPNIFVDFSEEQNN